MILLTIQEAAVFLRLTKRTLYLRVDIPRVRYGHRVMFIKEDLEAWILARREVQGQLAAGEERGEPQVDQVGRKSYHRNPLFVLHRSQGSR